MPPDSTPGTSADGKERSFAFGAFELFPQRRVLTCEGQPVRLGGRALDILLLLVENAGRVVGKDELIAHVWPKTFVEEANLRVHLTALRKVLGDGQNGERYIVNVVGRGYSFVAPLRAWEPQQQISFQSMDARASAGSGLPAPLGPLIGRADTVKAIASQILQHRFVTICGSPGIGKTSVALAVAEHLAGAFQNNVKFVDLAPLTDPSRLTSTIASALGIQAVSADIMQSLLEYLRGTRHLIVLDNCEHVIDAAADFAERALRGTTNTHVLATSREPLHAVGEHLQRLVPLSAPAEGALLDLNEARSFPAVELFVTRALASQDTLEFSDDDVPVLADLCRRLDGLPLAIELVAARVAQLGVHDLARRFEDRFQVLKQGRRTALPRHQTLRATLDWSYDLLPEAEKRILLRLSVFAGQFTSEAAVGVATCRMIDHSGVMEGVGNLSAKSLLSVDISGSQARYRLLETTRSYAIEKQRTFDAAHDTARRHAEYMLKRLQEAERRYEDVEDHNWHEDYAGLIDDVRSAIDWATSCGEWKISIDLLDAAATLFFHLYLSAEYRARLEHALEHAGAMPELDQAQEMRLCISLGIAIFNTKGPVPEQAAASARALSLADLLKAETYQLRALWGLARERYASGDYASALAFSERFGQVARETGNDEAILVHARMMSLALHLVGKHDEARDHAMVAIAPVSRRFRPRHRNFYQYDFGVTARAHLARILWIRGLHQEATAIAEEAIEAAHLVGSAISLCNALALGACPVAIWDGNTELADTLVSTLLESSTSYSLGYWHQWGCIYRQVLDLAAGRPAIEVPGTLSALQIDMLGTLDPRLITPEAVQRATGGAAAWSAPEVMRGDCVNRLAAGTSPHQVEGSLWQALSIARAQKAKSWELRCSLDIGSLLAAGGRRDEASELVSGALHGMGNSASRDVARARTFLGSVE